LFIIDNNFTIIEVRYQYISDYNHLDQAQKVLPLLIPTIATRKFYNIRLFIPASYRPYS